MSFSGVDPEISLGIRPPTVQPLGGALDMVSGVADVQNKLNQLMLFRQSFAAEQAAGQIMASAPDMAAGIKAIQENPLTAGFAPEIADSWAGTQNALLQAQGQVMTQASNGYSAWVKSLPAVLADPSQYGAVTTAALATMSPAARAEVAPAMEAIRLGLTSDLPTEPGAARATFQRRLSGLMLGAGVDPGNIYATLGTIPPQVQAVPTPSGSSVSEIIGGIPGGEGAQGAVLGRTPSTIESGELAASGSVAKELTEGANSVLDQMPSRIASLDAMYGAMKSFRTGGLQPIRQAVASFAQGLKNMGLPVTEANIEGINDGGIDASQFFNTQLKPMLVKQLSSDAHGSGRVMLPEVETYIHLLDTSKDPRAIVHALNLIKYAYQVGYDKANKWNAYKAQGLDPAQFESTYTSNFNPAKLPRAAGTMNLAPYDPTQVMGGAPTAAPADIQSLLKKYGAAAQGAQ